MRHSPHPRLIGAATGVRGTAGERGYTISINISAAEAIDEWFSTPPPSLLISLNLFVCPPSLQLLSLPHRAGKQETYRC